MGDPSVRSVSLPAQPSERAEVPGRSASFPIDLISPAKPPPPKQPPPPSASAAPFERLFPQAATAKPQHQPVATALSPPPSPQKGLPASKTASLRKELDLHASQRMRATAIAMMEPYAHGVNLSSGSRGLASGLPPLHKTFAHPSHKPSPLPPVRTYPTPAPSSATAVPTPVVPRLVFMPPKPPAPAPTSSFLPPPAKAAPPPAAPAPTFAKPPPMSTPAGVPHKTEFAKRLELRAKLERENKKGRVPKRSIDLVNPGGMEQKKPEKKGPKRSRLANIERISPYSFSPEQKVVVGLVQAGKSVFFTGSAGTGKSTLLREIVKLLPRSTTFVTASTGMAAINIGGITLHQFAGVGLGTESAAVLAQKALRTKARNSWMNAKVLVIDEVSMVDAEFFDKLEYIARTLRKDNAPFGGIQLICCGDFFQLPPVGKGREAKFCFESPKWRECIQCNIELVTVYRQSDAKFVKMLNELRHGVVSDGTKQTLLECQKATLKVPDGIEPTRLYPLNRDVDKMNDDLLNGLPSAGKVFTALDLGPEQYRKALENHAPAPTNLRLKPGAQVILLKNLSTEKGLVNGARGVVIGFDDSSARAYPIVRFISGIEKTIEPETWPIQIADQEVASRSQLPLRLGWAISIHKSQGLTLTFAEISLASVFEYGQAYVALSRVSSLSGLKLVDFKESAVRAHPKVIDFYKTFDDYAKRALAAAPPPPPPPADATLPAALRNELVDDLILEAGEDDDPFS